MDQGEEDHVAARIIETEMAVEPVAGFLELGPQDLMPGNRDQSEAFVANAPSLYGRERDIERLFMVLDVAVSAVQADPLYGGGYSLIAACIYRMGVRDFDLYDSRALAAAIPWANRARVVDPGYDLGWETYVEAHCYKGDFKTAENALGEIYKRFGDNDLYARTAFLYFRLQGNTAQALNWGALAWQTEWDSMRLVHTLFALGQLYRDVGEYAKALDAYRVITERDRENAWAYHYASICAVEIGNFGYALEMNGNAVKFGDLHQFRAYRETIKKLQGRTRMGIKPDAVLPKKGSGVRRPESKIVPAPPPAKPESNIVKAPPPARSPRSPTGKPNRRKPTR